MRFWTSDHHFGHFNCLKYCGRPLVCEYGRDTICDKFCGRPSPTCLHYVYDMMVDRWNAKISPEDEVIYLGDLAMDHRQYKVLHKLNFGSMRWILGNHDKENKVKKFLAENEYLSKKIELLDFLYVNVGGHYVHAIHRPVLGSDQCPVICGHVHEKWKTLDKGTLITEHNRFDPDRTRLTKHVTVNVGVDVNGFYPVSDDELIEILDLFQGEPPAAYRPNRKK